MRVTNGIPLGSSPRSPVDAANCVATLKALEHPYFTSLHDAMDEPISPGVFDSSFEDITANSQGWFQMVCQEIHNFRTRTDIPK
jgi:hypothetical protein